MIETHARAEDSERLYGGSRESVVPGRPPSFQTSPGRHTTENVGSPLRWNTHGTARFVSRVNFSVSARWGVERRAEFRRHVEAAAQGYMQTPEIPSQVRPALWHSLFVVYDRGEAPGYDVACDS